MDDTLKTTKDIEINIPNNNNLKNEILQLEINLPNNNNNKVREVIIKGTLKNV